MRHSDVQRDAVMDAASGIANAESVEVECVDCGHTFEMNAWVVAETPRQHQRCEACDTRGR